MFNVLMKLFRISEKMLRLILPIQWIQGYRSIALKIGLRLFPKRFSITNTQELEAHLDNYPTWREPALPDWALSDLEDLVAIDAAMHPKGEYIACSRFYSSPLIYDLPGKVYFNIKNKIPSHVDVILFVPWLKTGGSDLGAIHFANALADDLGRSVVVIATEAESSPWKSKLSNKVVFVEIGEELVSLKENHKLDILVRLALQTAPQVIHIMNSRLAWELVKQYGLAIRQQSKIFASLYCDDFNSHGQRVGYAQQYLPSCYRWLDGVISDNSTTFEVWINRMGVPRSLFHVVPFPAPSGPAKKESYTSSSNVVLWAGRLDHQKRPDLLLEIARLAPELEFDVYGQSVLNDYSANDITMQPNINLKGAYSDFSSIVSERHGAYLYTSQWDGLPNVLLEAAAAGLPIIASDVGAISELLDPEQLVCPFEDVEQYVTKLRKLITSADIKREWSSSQFNKLQHGRSWNDFIGHISNLPGYFDVEFQSNKNKTAFN